MIKLTQLFSLQHLLIWPLKLKYWNTLKFRFSGSGITRAAGELQLQGDSRRKKHRLTLLKDFWNMHSRGNMKGPNRIPLCQVVSLSQLLLAIFWKQTGVWFCCQQSRSCSLFWRLCVNCFNANSLSQAVRKNGSGKISQEHLWVRSGDLLFRLGTGNMCGM